MLTKLAIEYFDAFVKADIVGLEKLLSKDVSLRDWNLDVSGIESVLNEYKRVFESMSNVAVEVLNLYETESSIIAELIIGATEFGSIKVVDIISFDENFNICSIRAYKG